VIKLGRGGGIGDVKRQSFSFSNISRLVVAHLLARQRWDGRTSVRRIESGESASVFDMGSRISSPKYSLTYNFLWESFRSTGLNGGLKLVLRGVNCKHLAGHNEYRAKGTPAAGGKKAGF